MIEFLRYMRRRPDSDRGLKLELVQFRRVRRLLKDEGVSDCAAEAVARIVCESYRRAVRAGRVTGREFDVSAIRRAADMAGVTVRL